MFSSVKPNFADATISQLPVGKRIWLTLRNDDFVMTRWGDSAYARDYIKNMPGGDKLAGFMMGSSGYIWGREWMSTEPESLREQTLDKHWYYFMLFGRLAYDPGVPAETFRRTLGQKFRTAEVSDLFDAWAAVSKIIPLVNQFHWQDADFQWYPEACTQRARGVRILTVTTTCAPSSRSPPNPGAAMTSIPAYVTRLLAGTPMTGITPLDVSKALRNYADEGLRKIEQIDPGDDKEFRLTLGDIRAVAYLGYYYSEKVLWSNRSCPFRENREEFAQGFGH